VNASAGWEGRQFHTSVALPSGSIILMGGWSNSGYLNDVWRSDDYGATWICVNASAGWTERESPVAVAMPDGSIVLMGGFDNDLTRNDAWRSTDGGTTWTQLPDADWTARKWHSSAVLPDGSILVMGGTPRGSDRLNDVWRLQTAGSLIQNPVHTYTVPGTYKVTLLAYNANGCSTTQGSITVKISLPIADFTANVTAGPAPLAVRFTDLSTGDPTGWSWSFGDGNTSTEQNPVHTYTAPGNYTVNLTASSEAGSTSLSRPEYISVTVRGDLNRDGEVDIGDVSKVAYMVVGEEPEDLAADFNENGKVDIGDAAKIAYYFVGKIDAL